MNADRLDQLMARVRTGDETAYALFLAKAADRLRADLRRSVPGEEALEEVVRNCLIAVHRKRHTLGAGRSAGPWLGAIGQYVLVGYWRKHGKSAARMLAADAAHGFARLVNLDPASSDELGARGAAVLPNMMVRMRRAMHRKPQMVGRSQA